MMMFARWATALISLASRVLHRWRISQVRTLYLSPRPQDRLGKTGAAALKRRARKLRNCRKHRHARA